MTDDEHWLKNTFQTHEQMPYYEQERIIEENNRFNYYQPILDAKGNVVGNFRVTLDHRKYFAALFQRFASANYQWQWLIDDEGEILQDNSPQLFSSAAEYQNIDRIVNDIYEGSTGNLRHRAMINGSSRQIISSYCPVTLLAGMEYGIVFSAPVSFFQIYVARNAFLIVILTLFLVVVIILAFRAGHKREKSRMVNKSESEEMINQLLAEMPVGVIIYNKEREVIKTNSIAADFYSYGSEEEMIGKIYPQSHITDEDAYFSKYLGGKFSPDQFVIIKKEIGELVLFRSSIPLTYMDSDVSMEILIDVTMLESARKEEAQANIAKSEFLARMSYEIRTPLNGIIGIAEMLAKKETNPELIEMVSILRRSSELLLVIINDILDFSQIESGKIILDELPFDLRQELGFCHDLLQSHLEGRNIDISFEAGEDIPKSIIGDPFRLRQIFTNLALFSLEGTEKGRIEMTCRKKSVKEGVISFECDLRNTGRAWSNAELKSIFGEFVDGDSIPVRSNDGSALSTVLARQLVEIMGGSLKASSPSGLSSDVGSPGMRIRFSFDAYSNDRIAKRYDKNKVKKVDEIKALVITGVKNRDDEVIQVLHKAGLKPAVTGYTPATVNQIKANSKDTENRYNLLVITDDSDNNGFEVGEQIAQEGLHADYAIIMVSSSEVAGNYLKCINLGIDHYLVKPLDSNEIMSVLTESFPLLSSSKDDMPGRDRHSNLGILLVEDNKMNRIVIGSLFKSLGYAPDFANNGAEALEMTANRHYDIVFMDLIMPEMDGYEASRKILQRDKNVIITALTADSLTETRKKAELSGIREFIVKPVRPDHIKSVLRKYFGDY